MLSAAHCFDKRELGFSVDCSDISVVIGMHRKDRDGTKIDVSHIETHPGYDAASCYNNDFSLQSVT